MIIASIQARIGSTRLPGKVLKSIIGKPLLLHIIERLKKSKYIDKIIIATTTNPEDDAIESFGKKHNIAVHRGSEEDYVARHLEAAEKLKAKVLIRIWGDCPLIDHAIVDQGIQLFLKEKADFCSNRHPRKFPIGMDFEIYKIAILKHINDKVKKKFYHKYPFEYVLERKHKYKVTNLDFDKDYSYLYLVVDYPKDFDNVIKIFNALYSKDNYFHLKDILLYLDQKPSLFNAIKQNRKPSEYQQAKQIFKNSTV